MCDYPDIFELKILKARKHHSCCECKLTIVSGQKYQHVKGLWDGSWFTYKTCLHCVSLSYRVSSVVDHCDPPEFTRLHQWVFEYQVDLNLKEEGLKDRSLMPYYIDSYYNDAMKLAQVGHVGKLRLFGYEFV